MKDGIESMQTDLLHLTRNVSKLPACSVIAMEIIRFGHNSEIDKSDFLKLISSDPIISIQILRTANASLYNYPKEIISLEKALVILGFDMLRDIALSLSVISLFKAQNHQKYSHEICRHSLITALTLKILGQNYDSDNKDLLYLGGLLHDIGKILLLSKLGDEYFFLIEKDKQETTSLIKLENKFLGQNHAEIGAELADRWNLPPSVVSMIRSHHNPEQDNFVNKQNFRNQLVYLGNLIAWGLEMYIEGPINPEELIPDLEKNFAISKQS